MDLLTTAYDPGEFRRQGHALIDLLADHLDKVHQRTPAAINYQAPNDALAEWTARLEEQPQAAGDLFATMLDRSVQVHHPHFMGHQISPPVPIAALAGLVGDFLNNGMGVYEMGVGGTASEQAALRLVAKSLGFGDGAGGFLTSGGTLANVTALLTIRSVKAPTAVWTDGAREPLAIMVSEEAHYCVDRAVRIMGWGEAGVIKVPSDEHYRMRTDLLEDYYQRARQAGITVLAVVGSACSTAAGAFDDLNAIADFCAKHDLWFHIDGAHGAALAFSPTYEHVVAGLERADSVCMDFHKMLLTPSITTALIYRDVRDSYRTFQQRADYLLEWEAREEWHNLARRTFECTKLMIGFKVYTILATYGTDLFEQYVTRVCDLGKAFAELLRRQPDFELLIDPPCNIICYRYAPAGLDDEALNTLNARIRQTMLLDGDFYLLQTSLRGRTWLRSTLSNPFTTKADLEAVIRRIEAVGSELVGY